ncbi:unnamed protein product [Brassicogethes aeneus]|uniref:Guanylate cyclase n=1 Tax=Brassicogethes aeneus TaxID=1431903 RepID=A0A9P0B5U6_BRAAE|nr:unnamed protein product [Brassicogethes aeneus]
MRLGLALLLVALLSTYRRIRSPSPVAAPQRLHVLFNLLPSILFFRAVDALNVTQAFDGTAAVLPGPTSSHVLPPVVPDQYTGGLVQPTKNSEEDDSREYSYPLAPTLESTTSAMELYTATAEPAKNLTSSNLKSENLGKKNLTVGYLTAVKGSLTSRQGMLVSGAIQMALDKVNSDPDLLPNVTLVLRWVDTKGETVVATREMTHMICDGVVAFFGPESTCHVEAIVAQSRNIPMISYKCSDSSASDVPTFARTEPPDTQVVKSVVSLMLYYKWNKFAIIYEEEWSTVAKSLVKEAEKRNMTINYERETDATYKCCSENRDCCKASYWYQFVQNSKNLTRIYVFLGSPSSLIHFMDSMQTLKLFENGEYIVISVDTNIAYEKEINKYLWESSIFDDYERCEDIPDYQSHLKRSKSLFIVIPTAPTVNYENFSKEVREYGSKQPFNFITSDYLKKFERYVPLYAAYLYDSVILYSNALHYLLAGEKILNEKTIDKIASNGTKIIETIININKTYKSVIGTTMKLDEKGDSEGNFSVLAFQNKSYSYEKKQFNKNFTCSFQMVAVGQFYQLPTDDFPAYRINSSLPIEWPGKDKPNDEPSCGFNNELCPKPNTHLNSIIAAGALGIVLFCACVITMSIYRKWKIEQEIEGLLWKIDKDEIQTCVDRDIVSSPSKQSLISAISYESRGGQQVFTTTAQYRGVWVRIKTLTFSRKKDISREVMKEMRLLRELRHDNVNSFIGACVEPMSVLLVTDYCAKGSLYDIIENEEFKLDKMFIASLVHDLVKGMLYLHNSMLICHGNLKSSNCVITSRWVLQVTDFGLAEMRQSAENDSIGDHQYFRNLFWKAPEILREPNAYIKGSQKGDIYAFAIIVYEIIGRRGPFGVMGYEPRDIIDLVKKEPIEGEEQPFRPDIDVLLDSEIGCDSYVIQVIKECWAENPDERPEFATIRSKLKRMKDGKNKNIMDQMMDMMVTYANHLEELVGERTRLLHEEKQKTEDLLHRMLPKPVAESLTCGYGVEPEAFEQVTIYFSDIVGFTAMSAESTPFEVVNFLNDLYTVFDQIIKGYEVYKVETIGDAYMVVSGLPIRNGERHAGEIASMALELLAAVNNSRITHRPKETLKLRIGIHTGPVVAGVVGLTMPRYCLFGDTVNTASRMESNGEPLKIHISVQCKDALDKLGGYIIEERGLVYMKGKGEVLTYWLTGATEMAIQKREVELGQDPPLFCRPRKSPKLYNDSRQPSICGGFGGMNSRRHSSVPRGTSIEVESTSTLQNSSPVPSRHLKVNRQHNLHVPDAVGSKTTINTAFGSQLIEVPEESRKPRKRRMLSSIASSTDEYNKSATEYNANRVRESKSLDPLPLAKIKLLEIRPTPELRRSTRSLENCDKCGDVQIFAIPEDKLLNNNFPNGNLSRHDDDVEVPLLDQRQLNTAIVRRRGGSTMNDSLDSDNLKKWRSLESVPASCDPHLNKKKSVKSWITEFFKGNGVRSSNTSLRRAVINEYNNLQPESESIV